MTIIKFFDHFRREGQGFLGTVQQGQEDFPKLDMLIRETRPDETILFDISGFDLFGYSYAKQTIRKVLQMAKAGIYDHRFFLVYAKNKDEADDLSSALQQMKLSTIGSTTQNPKTYYRKYFVLGELNEVQSATLDYVISKKEVTSGVSLFKSPSRPEVHHEPSEAGRGFVDRG
jgi:hypothetical protein